MLVDQEPRCHRNGVVEEVFSVFDGCLGVDALSVVSHERTSLSSGRLYLCKNCDGWTVGWSWSWERTFSCLDTVWMCTSRIAGSVAAHALRSFCHNFVPYLDVFESPFFCQRHSMRQVLVSCLAIACVLIPAGLFVIWSIRAFLCNFKIFKMARHAHAVSDAGK